MSDNAETPEDNKDPVTLMEIAVEFIEAPDAAAFVDFYDGLYVRVFGD